MVLTLSSFYIHFPLPSPFCCPTPFSFLPLLSTYTLLPSKLSSLPFVLLFTHFTLPFTLYAHMFYYSLGSAHDGVGNDCSADDKYVMAPSSEFTDADTIGNPWRFSSCSTSYFDAFIVQLDLDG